MRQSFCVMMFRSLPAHHGQVVIEAGVADAVVLAQKLSLTGEGPREIRRRRRRSEGLVESFVFQDDDEYVPDGRRRCRECCRGKEEEHCTEEHGLAISGRIHHQR